MSVSLNEQLGHIAAAAPHDEGRPQTGKGSSRSALMAGKVQIRQKSVGFGELDQRRRQHVAASPEIVGGEQGLIGPRRDDHDAEIVISPNCPGWVREGNDRQPDRLIGASLGTPFPILDFGHVFTMLPDVAGMIGELVADLLAKLLRT